MRVTTEDRLAREKLEVIARLTRKAEETLQRLRDDLAFATSATEELRVTLDRIRRSIPELDEPETQEES